MKGDRLGIAPPLVVGRDKTCSFEHIPLVRFEHVGELIDVLHSQSTRVVEYKEARGPPQTSGLSLS